MDQARRVALESCLAVGLTATAMFLALPGYLRARERAFAEECRANLARIEGAKIRWEAVPHQGMAAPKIEELIRPGRPGWLWDVPRCPCGHAYRLGAPYQAVECDSGRPGHQIWPSYWADEENRK